MHVQHCQVITLITKQDFCPALVVGAFAMQLVEGLPQEATDYKVEWVVTENETIQCASDRPLGK